MRVFVSIDLPEEVKAKLFHAFETLKNSGNLSAKFVEKENIHLSLKFLGELTEEQIEKVKKRLEKIEFTFFSCETEGIGFFPSESYIRVIWTGLLGDKLFELQKKIDDALVEEGFEKEKREFKGHITLARVKAVHDKKNFQEKIKNIILKPMKFQVDKFSLVKSELTNKGPIYKKLEDFKLG